MKSWRMSKWVIVLCSILAGCSAYGGPGVTGAFPGTMMTNATYPGTAVWSTVNYKMDNYEVIGEVTADAESTSILGVFASGDSGYIKLYKAAKAEGADDLINVKIDCYYYNILNVYSVVRNKLYGVAIKWKK